MIEPHSFFLQTFNAWTFKICINRFGKNVSSTGSICSGVASSITLSGSTVGIIYKLMATGYDGSVLAGTGSPLTFTPPANILATSTIEATNTVTLCKALMTGSIATTNPINPTVTITAQNNVSCFGGNNGSVTAVASAGSGSYTYTFNGRTSQPTGVFSGKTAGTYPIVAMDANTGCIGTVSAVITQPTSLSSDIVATSGIACVGNTVTLTTTATGGTGTTHMYNWNATGFVSSSTLAFTSTSTNTLIIKDVNGCTSSAVSSITVTFNTPTPPTISGSTILCSGSILSLSSSVTGTYAWSGPNSFTATSAAINISDATVSNSGTYIVAVTNVSGCTASAMATITVNPVIAVPTTQAFVSISSGESSTLTATGCSGTLRWFKSPDDLPVLMPISPTTVTSYYAKCEVTANGVTCTSTKSADVVVTVGIISIKTGGAWDDLATWNVGRIPLSMDEVIIDTNHNVIITTLNAVAKKLSYRTNAKVTFGNSATKLTISGL